MKIELSENTLGSIIELLNKYLHSNKFDKNYVSKMFYMKEDVELMIKISRALGELQGAVNAVKDMEDDK